MVDVPSEVGASGEVGAPADVGAPTALVVPDDASGTTPVPGVQPGSSSAAATTTGTADSWLRPDLTRARYARDGRGSFTDVTTRPTPQSLLDELVDDLCLETTGDPDRFVGQNVQQPFGRVFGGQVLGQALMAAGRTVDADRPPHSLHAYFLRPGDPEVPVEFAVERLRDGRSFSARRTHAMQHGKPILSMIASFQVPAEGFDHADEMPAAPAPESLPTTAQQLEGVEHPAAAYWSFERPMDVRNVDGPIFLGPAEDREPDNAVWLRTPAALPDEPLLHAAVMAFASDYSLLEAILRRHGLSWVTRGLKMASLDHAMWFHRPARMDEWLLYTHHSPSASSARGLVNGRMFDRSGRLVTSVAQEGMLRVPTPPS